MSQGSFSSSLRYTCSTSTHACCQRNCVRHFGAASRLWQWRCSTALSSCFSFLVFELRLAASLSTEGLLTGEVFHNDVPRSLFQLDLYVAKDLSGFDLNFGGFDRRDITFG